MTITETRDRTTTSPLRPAPRTGRVQQSVAWVQGVLHRNSLAALRIALGAVYVWFGALKVTGSTPVGALVEATTPWADPSWFVPAMGVFEVILGLWLIAGRGLFYALPLFVGHMIGTFGVLVMVPEVAFQSGNPLALTVEGEFVVKNLVLLAAVIVVATRTTIRRRGVTA